VVFEPYSTPLKKRLDGAAKAQEAGAKVTIHLDPIVSGIEDTEELLAEFFKDLESRNLKRIMFSYLLLSEDIIANMKKTIDPVTMEKILSVYELDDSIQCLPTQTETRYYFLTPAARNESASRISSLLNKMGFDFVLCSIKNDPNSMDLGEKACPSCDGSFYA
jgi:DNA repair photolyase